jgi:hypothetical protein
MLLRSIFIPETAAGMEYALHVAETFDSLSPHPEYHSYLLRSKHVDTCSKITNDWNF